MKIENLNQLYHPEFRVCGQVSADGQLVDIYLLQRQGGVAETQLSAALIKNTPEDGVLALLERYWQLEKYYPSPLYAAAPDMYQALKMMIDNPLEPRSLRFACAAMDKADGGSA